MSPSLCATRRVTWGPERLSTWAVRTALHLGPLWPTPPASDVCSSVAESCSVDEWAVFGMFPVFGCHRKAAVNTLCGPLGVEEEVGLVLGYLPGEFP